MSQINQNNEKIEKENRGEVRVLDARPLTRVWHLEVRRHSWFTLTRSHSRRRKTTRQRVQNEEVRNTFEDEKSARGRDMNVEPWRIT